LHAGSVLVLFTDGLVEGRYREISEGTEDLRGVIATHDPAAGSAVLAERLREHALALAHSQEDDVCLLVVTVA